MVILDVSKAFNTVPQSEVSTWWEYGVESVDAWLHDFLTIRKIHVQVVIDSEESEAVSLDS